MKTTINERIMMLKSESGLSNLDFCHAANISNGTLHNIQNGENVSPKTIKTLCDALNLNKEWLMTGNGEKFLPIENSQAKGRSQADIWQDATYKSLNDQIVMLKALVKQLSKGELNFLKLLPEMDSENSNELEEQVRDAA